MLLLYLAVVRFFFWWLPYFPNDIGLVFFQGNFKGVLKIRKEKQNCVIVVDFLGGGGGGGGGGRGEKEKGEEKQVFSPVPPAVQGNKKNVFAHLASFWRRSRSLVSLLFLID